MQLDIMGINILFAIVSAILILIYLKYNNISYSTNKTLLYIIIFGLINGILSTKTASLGDVANTIKPLLLVALSIIIIKFILNLKLVKSTIIFLLLFIGMAIGNSMSILIIGAVIKGDAALIITTDAFLYLLSNLIVMVVTILFLLAIKPLNKIIKQVLNNKDLAFALIFTLIIISANAGLHFYIKIFNFIAFLIISIMSIVYCAYVIFNSTVIYRRQIEKTEKEQQEFYNKSLENTLFNLRRFKHDWTNNLQVINAMLEMNKVKEARAYLHEIMEYNTIFNNTSLLNIQNAGLFGIISSKQSLAISKGLNIEINGIGEINAIPGIKMSELCEVIGIFLDNAIEESEKINQNIELQYIDTPTSIEISIKNKCEKDIDLSEFGKESSKGSGRGNGLKIIDQIISKYKHVANFRTYETENKTLEQLLVIEKGL